MSAVLGNYIAEAANGFASGQRDEHGVIQLRMNNVSPKGTIDLTNSIRVPITANQQRFVLKTGDVLFNHTNSTELVGKTALFEGHSEDVVFSNHFTRLRVTPDRVDARYLALFINHLWNQGYFRDRCQVWVGQSAVRYDVLAAAPAAFPDLDTQRRIASRLKEQMATIEQARQKVQEQVRHVETLRSKCFREAFHESVLADWDKRSLLDIARIVSGMTLGGPMAKSATTKVPYLRVANVKDGWLMLDDVKEIDATERDIEQFQLRHGDVVLTEGGDPDKLGRGTVWRDEISLCLHQNHIFRVRFDSAQVCPEFAAYQFASPYGKAYFLAHAKQTTGIASINKGVLSRFPFRLPPLATQRRIAARLREQFECLQQLKAALSTQLAALDKLPGAFLREAFGSLC